MTSGEVLGTAWAEHRVPLMAALTARLGDLDRAEDALSEAVLRAQRHWAEAVPDNPPGWLYRVALNAARDVQRREARAAAAQSDPLLPAPQDEMLDVSPQARLALFRLCAHPSLSQEQQIALMLFHLAGVDCAAIGRAFLVSEGALHQRLSRARAKLKTGTKTPEGDGDLSAVRSALEVIYHQSHRDVGGGPEAEALGRDALHLAAALCAAAPEDPESWGLLALLHALDARRPVRLSADGRFVPLDAQDASLWSPASMRDAAAALRRAANWSDEPGAYGVRAQIELTRMIARREGVSRDAELLVLHDLWLALTGSPFAAMERALVLARVKGPQAGLDALAEWEERAELLGHAGWHLARAELHTQLGDTAQARQALRAALTQIDGEVERAFVTDKLRALPA